MSDLDRAGQMAAFLDGQHEAWHRHLKTFGNAHWHIINHVRSHGDEGVSARLIYAHLCGIFGLDMSTCLKRIKELIARDLLSADNETLSRTSIILPTEKLSVLYDAYCADLASIMIEVSVGGKPAHTGGGHPEISDRIDEFFQRFGDQSKPALEKFIRDNLVQPARRERARKCIPTYGYWQSTFFCWKQRREGSTYVKGYDVHHAVYDVLRKGSDATRQILNDLIAWGFLVRKGSADGVPNNSFAVAISDGAYDLYTGMFERAHDLLVSASEDLLRCIHSLPRDDSTVVPLKRPLTHDMIGQSRGGTVGRG